MSVEKKICIDCHRMKPLDAYYERPDSVDGHYHKCRECSDLHKKNNAKPYVHDPEKAKLAKARQLDKNIERQRKSLKDREIKTLRKLYKWRIQQGKDGGIWERLLIKLGVKP